MAINVKLQKPCASTFFVPIGMVLVTLGKCEDLHTGNSQQWRT